MQQLNLHTKSSKWPLFCSGSGVLQRRRCLENWEDVQEMYQQQGLQNEPCFNLVFVEMHLYTPVTPVHKFICPVTHGECCDRIQTCECQNVPSKDLTSTTHQITLKAKIMRCSALHVDCETVRVLFYKPLISKAPEKSHWFRSFGCCEAPVSRSSI